MDASFRKHFVEIFNADFNRLYRYLDRVSGDSELAAELAQEAFLRLARRGSVPDNARGWLISVAMNLFRNARTTHSRRAGLLTHERAAQLHADPPPSPALQLDARQTRERVHSAIDQLPQRERDLLLLHAEGYSYREIADALHLNEASVGTLLARAKRAFLRIYGSPDASD